MKASQEKPWLKYFSEEAKNAHLKDQTIYQYLIESSKNKLDDIAINYFDNKISYKKLISLIDDCAASLFDLGIKKGDMVACCSATTPEIAILLYALNKIGAALYTIDPRRSVEEIKQFVHDSKAKLLFVIDLAYNHVVEIFPDINVEKIVITDSDKYMSLLPKVVKKFTIRTRKTYSDRVISWNKFINIGKGKPTYTVPSSEFELAAITLTGGTTGSPKGVMLSNKGFNSVAFDFLHSGVDIVSDKVFMDIIPIFSSYGIVASIHMPLILGFEILMIPKLNANKIGNYFKKYRPGHTLLVPTYYEQLINSPDLPENYDLSYLVTAGSGGDTMNADLEHRLNEFLRKHKCKYPLSQGYGMSEVSSAGSCCCGNNFKSLSVGYPLLLNTIAIFKPDTDEELDYNQEGEVCFTGPSNMLGYYNNEKETKNVMKKHSDGNIWIHSGDLGYMDEDGFLFIKGRIKRMITRFDGHKVFPTQLESSLVKIDNINNCVIVGIKDPNHAQGELPLAVITLQDDSKKEETLRKLKEYIENEVEERGRPCDIKVVKTIPYTSVGKVDYKSLTKQINKKL